MLHVQVGTLVNLAAYWHWLDVGLNSFLFFCKARLNYVQNHIKRFALNSDLLFKLLTSKVAIASIPPLFVSNKISLTGSSFFSSRNRLSYCNYSRRSVPLHLIFVFCMVSKINHLCHQFLHRFIIKVTF